MSSTFSFLEDITGGEVDNSTADEVCGPKFSESGFTRGDINVVGLVVVILFYVLILVVGILASLWYRRKANKSGIDTESSENVIIAGRNIGMFVGVFTMTATWVGGGYINGTAEFVYTPGSGLAWTQAPWGYSLSLILGGLFFAQKMRREEYVTMLDPFERKYGRVVAALLYIPALCGEVFWTAAILSALGATLTVIVGLNDKWAIIISAAISVFYTLIGGLYSVAFTDVIQLICIFIGLWLCIPFALLNDAVGDIGENAKLGADGWVGKLYPNDPWVGNWLDSALLLIFGGIPWQVYFQRVLSQKTSRGAQVLSFAAGFGCMFMAVPAILIGAIGKSTDWNQTEYRDSGCIPMRADDYKLILPLVLHYLTPTPVAVIGLGAVSAAVMSSADSSVLSASSMFARNIWAPLSNAIRSCCGNSKKTSEREITWVLRVSVLLIAGAAMAMAILVNSIYGLWYLCGDLVYVVLFPQLVLVLYMEHSNSYGALAGFIIGLFFRLTGGEPLLNLPALIKYPYYDEDSNYQLIPFKTMCMVITFIVCIIGSYIARFIFLTLKIRDEFDIFDSFKDKKVDDKASDFSFKPADEVNGFGQEGKYHGRDSLNVSYGDTRF